MFTASEYPLETMLFLKIPALCGFEDKNPDCSKDTLHIWYIHTYAMWSCCQRPTGDVRLLVQWLAIFRRRPERHFSGAQWCILWFNTCKRHTYYASYRWQCLLAKSQNQTQWAFPPKSRLQSGPSSTPSVNSLLQKALTRITSRKEGGRRVRHEGPRTHFYWHCNNGWRFGW